MQINTPDQNNAPTIPAPPPVDTSDDEPTIPMKRVELDIFRAICSVGLRCVVAFVAAWIMGQTLGCAGRVERAPDVAPPVAVVFDSYVVDQFGTYTGYQGMLAAKCSTGDEILNATCNATGGRLVTETAAYGGWECAAQWDNSSVGGTIAVHLECRRGDAVAPLDGTHGCDTCDVKEVP